MIPPQIPHNEAARQAALEETGLLDSAANAEFDDITALVAAQLGVPICLISLIDRDRQWFKSRYGLLATQTPRDISFCGHVVFDGTPLIVEDASLDARFADNPLVVGEPRVAAYAGMPLTDDSGHTLGTLCAIARQPHHFSDRDRAFLQGASRLVMNAIRRHSLERLKDAELRVTLDEAHVALVLVHDNGTVAWASTRATQLLALDDGAAHDDVDFASLFAETPMLRDAIDAAARDGRTSHHLVVTPRAPAAAARTFHIDVDPHTMDGAFRYARCRIAETTADDANARLRRYAALFDASPELLATLDGRGHIDHMNPSWERVLGWTRDEVAAQPFAAFVHPDDAPALLAMLGTSLLDGREQRLVKSRVRTRDGAYRIFSIAVGSSSAFPSLSARDITAQAAAEERFEFNSQLNKALSDLQKEYIQNAAAGRGLWERALALLLRITESQYGFIGTIHHDEGGRFLRTHAISDISWDETTRRLYDETRATGMEFRNLRTLFGRVIVDGQTIVANDVEHDARAGGRPPGHPPLRQFLGLACGQGPQMVGMVGLANRPAGYGPELVADLEGAAVVLSAIMRQSATDSERRRVESRLRAIIDSTLDVILTIDHHGTILAANPAIRSVFGHEPAECIGRSVTMLLHAPDADEPIGSLTQALRTGEAPLVGRGREILGLRKDGREVHLELTVWENTGEPERTFNALLRDVTERVNTETRLRDSAAQLSTALSLAKAGHWELDLAINRFTFNDEFYNIFGVTAEQVGGYHLSPDEYAARFVHPEELAVVRDEIQKALLSTTSPYAAEIEHRFVRANGSVGHLLVGIRGQRDETGTLRKLYGVVQDITARREREQERQQFLEQSRAASVLAERVAELDRARTAIGMLAECVTFLQRAVTVREGIDIIARYVGQMYPDDNIVIYTLDAGTDDLVMHSELQRFGTSQTPRSLELSDCWAVRTRSTYSVYAGGPHLRCNHHARASTGTFVCAPIAGADRLIGLLSVAFSPASVQGGGTEGSERVMRELARFETIAQSLSGAMSTIVLRESLQRLALVDELTGLPNRRAFMGSATRIAARARRTKDTFVAAMLDVDHFKSINDTYGHDEGDRVLRRLSELTTKSLRQEDLVGRLGGEEFGILLVGAEEGVRQKLEFVRSEISRASILRDRLVTVSIGYAVCDDLDQTTIEGLLKAADSALYRAKRAGRNCVMGADLTTPEP